MVVADKVELIAPGIHRWSAFSPGHKVELSSHSVLHAGVLFVFDPIPISPEILDWFPTPVAPSAIILTNQNHPRAAREWQERFDCPIWGPGGAIVETSQVRRFDVDPWPWNDWEICPLPGGAPGETVVYLSARKLAVFGDAVVNLAGRKLELLPDKYCESPVALRDSLRHFLEARPVEIALFAHGEPILFQAQERLKALISY
ncbi:MAG TPA: hypothetical protein VMF06_19375 [Candidatus Limnocylindria bacterium]|nr:hypothetical protein [Candidatus Limnocylindria bacterium]